MSKGDTTYVKTSDGVQEKLPSNVGNGENGGSRLADAATRTHDRGERVTAYEIKDSHGNTIDAWAEEGEDLSWMF